MVQKNINDALSSELHQRGKRHSKIVALLLLLKKKESSCGKRILFHRVSASNKRE